MPGEFTPSELQRINVMAEDMWTDSRHAQDLTPYADAAIAVLENQTATFTELKDRNKDRKIGVTFIDTCAVEADDCVSNCDLTEDELDTDVIEYELDMCKKAGFSVDATKLRTNSYDLQQVAAKGLATAVKSLDEYLAVQTLLKLKSFADINVAPAPFSYDSADKTTEIPAEYYNASLVSIMLKQAYMNKMGTPYYIDGGDLWLPWRDTQFDRGNSDGSGNDARIRALKMYFDLINFGKAGITDDTFMIMPGAVAIATKVTHPDTPEEIGGSVNQTWYTVPSIALPGVRYDAYYTLQCNTVGGKAHIKHNWRFELNGGIFLNPKGCPVTIGGTTYTPSGVLSYTKVNATT